MKTLQKQLSTFQKFLQLVETKVRINKSSFEAVHEICCREKILLSWDPEIKTGFYASISDKHIISINPNLPKQEKAHVAFHELGHFFLGHSKGVHFYSKQSDSEKEWAADLFAKLALMERSAFENLSTKVSELNLFVGSLGGENNE